MKPPMAGWIGFAAMFMIIVGVLDFFEGLIAIVRDHYFVVAGSQLIVFDMTTWGWVMLIWGIVLVLVGLALWSGAGWARWTTIVLSAINVILQLSWLGAGSYPLWTLVAITLNLVVIYALSVRWEGYPERAAV